MFECWEQLKGNINGLSFLMTNPGHLAPRIDVPGLFARYALDALNMGMRRMIQLASAESQVAIRLDGRQSHVNGSNRITLATVKAYCHLAFSAGKLDHSTHTHIQGVKGIPRKQSRNIDARREVSRVGHKKAQPIHIPLKRLPPLTHPHTGCVAKPHPLT